MNDTELYVLDAIKKWVWSGFYLPKQVHKMLGDILEKDVDEAAMRLAIDSEFEKKAEEEKSWPSVTDSDRLDQVFIELDQNGICACQNAGYEMSDGHTEIAEALEYRGAEKYRGYCFYHGQDLERAIDGHGLAIAFGDLNDDVERTIEVGHVVKRTLEKAGFKTEWDGTAEKRIRILKIDWKRRF